LDNGQDSTSKKPTSCPTHQLCPAQCEHLSCPFVSTSALLTTGNELSLTTWIAKMTAEMEKSILKQTLTLTHGNKAHAARLLHIDYKTIHSKLKAYEISSITFMHDVSKQEG
jgi:DNA-binding NtrC family response regulator